MPSAMGFQTLRVSALRRDTRDAVVVSFEVPATLRDRFRFTPGQYLTFRQEMDGEELRRNYSICSTPDERHLTVAIKRVAEGRFSTWANQRWAVGDEIQVMPPVGRFLRAVGPKAGRYLAVAAGSGITPILSILRTTLAQEQDCQFTLVYGNRAAHSVMFREVLEDLKNIYLTRLSLVHILSREPQDAEMFNGRIDLAKCRQLFSSWIDVHAMHAVYLCGPQSMMEDASQALIEAGVESNRIRREHFVVEGAPVTQRPRAATHVTATHCAVTVIQDGRSRQFIMQREGQSVLAAALAQGIELPWSCQAGVCSTCRCKLVEGEVEMSTQYALEDYEIRRGFRLACQSYPLSERLVLDYDQHT